MVAVVVAVVMVVAVAVVMFVFVVVAATEAPTLDDRPSATVAAIVEALAVVALALRLGKPSSQRWDPRVASCRAQIEGHWCRWPPASASVRSTA